MPQFQADMYYSFLFSTTGQVCIAAGWDLGQVLWQVKTTIQMRSCSKVLLYDICDLKSNWLGSSAEWLESCTTSVAPQVSVQNTEIAPAVANQNLMGGKTVNGPGCF